MNFIVRLVTVAILLLTFTTAMNALPASNQPTEVKTSLPFSKKHPNANLKLTWDHLVMITTLRSVAEQYKTSDGVSFEDDLPAMALVETALGKKVIGDGYSKRTGKKKALVHSSLGVLQIKPSTAKEIIRRQKLTHLNYLLKDDEKLTEALLSDLEVQATIAANFLVLTYEEAKKKGYSDPYFRAISRYNGGWSNKKYYNKIKSNRKVLDYHLSKLDLITTYKLALDSFHAPKAIKRNKTVFTTSRTFTEIFIDSYVLAKNLDWTLYIYSKSPII